MPNVKCVPKNAIRIPLLGNHTDVFMEGKKKNSHAPLKIILLHYSLGTARYNLDFCCTSIIVFFSE